MGKNINLNSGEWCDIVFEGKNKTYGAFKLRQTSSKRHVAALIVMLVFSVLVAVLPGLLGALEASLAARNAMANIDEDYKMTEMPVEAEIPQENIIEKAVVPPPPPLKSTQRFTPPVITEDENIEEDKMMRTQDELNESTVQISTTDIVGTDEIDGIDIAEIENNQVIVEKEPEPEIYETVESMPTFPGGTKAMMQFLQDNVKFPVIAQENGVNGRVMLRFVVTKTGAIDDVRIIRSLDPACDKEAVAAVKKMPKWVPGKQNGNNVAVYFTLPVFFRIQ